MSGINEISSASIPPTDARPVTFHDIAQRVIELSIGKKVLGTELQMATAAVKSWRDRHWRFFR